MGYQIRQLSLGGVLDEAIALTKGNFGALFQIVAVTMLPPLLIVSFYQFAVMPPLVFPFQQEQFVAWMEAQQKHGNIINMLSIVSAVASILGNAAVVHGISCAALGQSFTTKTALSQALKIFLPLIGTSVLGGLAVFVGTLLCIIPGIIATLWFAFTTPIVVIEGIGGIEALKRSKTLTEGNLGPMFVCGAVVAVIQLGVVAAPYMVPQPHVAIVLGVVVQCALHIFTSATLVMFYFSARCQHEQFDLQLLVDAVEAEIVLEVDDEEKQAT